MNDILFIVIDCCRYDRLHGNDQSLPNISKLRMDSVDYKNAFCQAPYTPASHASFFTGKNPYDHGIRKMYGHSLNPRLETVAEWLRSIGYHTSAFVGYDGLLSKYGLDRGFDYFDENSDVSKSWGKTPCGWKGNDWRESYKRYHDRPADQPRFTFCHYFFLHAGGENGLPDKYLDLKDESQPLLFQYYDAKLKWFDEEWLPTILAPYDMDNTTVILTADHGECFDPEKEKHGHRYDLWNDTVHIPLLIHYAGKYKFRGVDSGLIQSTDVFDLAISNEYKKSIRGHVYFETSNEEVQGIPNFRCGILYRDGDEDFKTVFNGKSIGSVDEVERTTVIASNFEIEIKKNFSVHDCIRIYPELADCGKVIDSDFNDGSGEHKKMLKDLGYM